MPLENATQIQQLVPTNPLGTDAESEGDNHLRMIKLCLQNSFPGMTAPWKTTSVIKAANPVAADDLVTLGFMQNNFANLQIGYPFIWILPSDPAVPAGQQVVSVEGQLISRVNYPVLFSLYGTYYGQGDGSTTFQLPDYSGYFLRVANGTSGRDPDVNTRTPAFGGSQGSPGSTQQDEIKSHTHDLNVQNTTVIGTVLGNGIMQGGARTTTATGGAETRAKNIYIRILMRLK